MTDQLDFFGEDDFPSAASAQGTAPGTGDQGYGSSRPDHQALFEGRGSAQSVAEVAEMLVLMAGMPNIGPYNAWLVQHQRRGAKYVASARGWAKVGRQVLPDSDQLVILHPGGPIRFVTELAETTGRKLPESARFPFAHDGSMTEEGWRWFLRRLQGENVDCQEQPRTSSGKHPSAASIRPAGRRRRPLANGRTAEEPAFEIRVDPALPLEERFAAVVRMLAHLYCGHLEHPDGSVRRRAWAGTAEAAEFEAAAVEYLVTARTGLRSAPPGLAEEHEEVPAGADVAQVASAATRIENLGGGAVPLGRSLRGTGAEHSSRSSAGSAALPGWEEPTLF